MTTIGADTGAGGQIQVLLVEDDPEIARLLGEFLQENDLAVTCVMDGLHALRRIEKTSFSVILLVLMLPGVPGLEVLDRIRRTSQTPVIILTAIGEEADKIEGLQRGADDYLVKPFSPRELLARIQSLLRRSGYRSESPTQRMEFQPLAIDCQFRDVSIDGQKVPLTDQEFETLLLLARNMGRVVTRDEMSKILLGRPSRTFDRAIDIRMSRLRAKIAPWGECIRSVRGMGYEFIPPHEVNAQKTD
ncbi:MAG: response regulator transcription factor [bacterium]